MLNDKLKLLTVLKIEIENKSSEQIINELKKLTHQYQDENNELVREIWDIDYRLLQENSDISTNKLLQQKADVESKILKGDYTTKIEKLLGVIYDMEIELYGTSRAGSTSPYIL